jgi:two-component system chemotaxis sensor kinase CheA
VSELDDELTDIFRDEAAERLDQMETALLAVESGDTGAEFVDSLFRNAHTIKGAAGMLGLGDIRALAHAVEEVLAGVRDAGVFRPGLASPLLRATAALRAQVTGVGSGEPMDDLIGDLAVSAEMISDGEAVLAEAGKPGAAREMGSETAEAGRSGATREAGSGAAEAGMPGAIQAAGSGPAVAPLPRAPEAEMPAAADAGPSAAVPAGAPLAGAPLAGTPRVGTAPPDRDARTADPAEPRPNAERRPLRVPAEKIDHLLDVVGEVIQHRGRLAHSLGGQAQLSKDVADVLAASDRMLDDLKDTAIGMRTLPLETITRRLPLAVRDLALAAGKEVELTVTGAGTEIDRVILESLHDPLAHLLRNAVGHGIETPAERERVHKPRCGRLEIRVVPRGSLVEIVVADDGRGISPEILDQAGHEGSLADVLARAGYSTAAEVTDLAGRGVGLDAVRSYARSLGGTFEVRSEPGRGMEVVLLLPLALALLEVLLFERGGAIYGVPLVAVEEIVVVAETLMLEGQPALEVRGRPLPVIDVAVLVGAAAPPLGDKVPALLISAAGRRAIATCDAVFGQQEVVVKPLGPLFGGVEGYLGAAILGDGRIALLIEPAMLIRVSRRTPGPAVPAEPRRAAAPRVLVVEDSFTVRELQRSILEAAGYPVVTARDGRDALAVLGRDPEIALVVTDLEMPELDGLELTRAIRADRVRSALPVIIVTSHGSEDDRRKGVAAGADAYMAKQSFDQQALLAIVERLVGFGRLQDAEAARACLRGLPCIRGRAQADARVRRGHHGRRGLRHRHRGDCRPASHQARPRDHGPRASRDGRAQGGRRNHELASIADLGDLLPRRSQNQEGGGRARRRRARRHREG